MTDLKPSAVARMVVRVAVTPSSVFVFMRLVNGFVSAVKRRYHWHCDPNLELGGGPGVMPRCLHQETNWSCGTGGGSVRGRRRRVGGIRERRNMGGERKT